MIPMEREVEKLKDLTDRIVPRLSAIVKSDQSPLIEYDVINGHAFGIHLFSSCGVSVNRFFATKGGILPEHSHKEKEWCILYDGSVVVKYKDRNVTLKPGDSEMIEPNVPHSAIYLENSWLIIITIPHGEGMAHDKL